MKILRFFAIPLISFLCLYPLAYGDTDLKIGSSPPPLGLSKILQAPEGTRGTWEELKGKAVVIEFWATWCGGCVDYIPHLNELAEKFASRPIQFISITDETDQDGVQRFLERHPIRGWVAFDHDASTFKTYGIEGRPQTLLIGSTGILRAITNPLSVTTQVLDDLLSDKPLNFPERRMGPLLGLEAGAPTPLIQVLIRPAAPVAVSGTSPGGVIEKDGRFDAYGQTITSILLWAYGVPEDRIDSPDWCKRVRYDVSIVTPQHQEGLRSLFLRQALEGAFQLKAHKDDQPTRVYLLKTIASLDPKLRLVTTHGQSKHWNPAKGELEAIGSPISMVTYVAQFVLGKDVIDETGLRSFYDFDLKWDPNDPQSIINAVHDQLGLELMPESQLLEHLVVDSITQPSTW